MLELTGEAGLRVLDIRGHVFSVRLDGKEHEWEIDGLEALIDTLNRRLAGRKDVKALVNLGEWEDMLQVWALPRDVVAELQKSDWFKPANPAGLKASLEGRVAGALRAR